jgi:hypothetical protein
MGFRRGSGKSSDPLRTFSAEVHLYIQWLRTLSIKIPSVHHNLQGPLCSIHYCHQPICISFLNHSLCQLPHLFDNETLTYQILYSGLV